MNQKWFMQDCASPNTANATLEVLKQKFGNRVISQMNGPWAAHFPDLNSVDFFLGDMPKIMCMLTNQGHFRC